MANVKKKQQATIVGMFVLVMFMTNMAAFIMDEDDDTAARMDEYDALDLEQIVRLWLLSLIFCVRIFCVRSQLYWLLVFYVVFMLFNWYLMGL